MRLATSWAYTVHGVYRAYVYTWCTLPCTYTVYLALPTRAVQITTAPYAVRSENKAKTTSYCCTAVKDARYLYTTYEFSCSGLVCHTPPLHLHATPAEQYYSSGSSRRGQYTRSD